MGLFKNVKLFNSSLGIGTYIGKSSEIIYAKIGKYCSIADNVHIGLGTHPTSIFVTTHPSFYHDTYKTLGFGYTKTESFNPTDSDVVVTAETEDKPNPFTSLNYTTGYFPINSTVVTNGAGASYDTKYYIAR